MLGFETDLDELTPAATAFNHPGALSPRLGPVRMISDAARAAESVPPG